MSATPIATEFVAAAQRIDDWLLHGPAQVRSGPRSGAVGGSFDADGGARYVYPEITGYYLQWLAWCSRHAPDQSGLATRAAAAQAWLGAWARTPNPQTRVYLQAADEDWRNRTLFTFDIAMAVRGIGAAVAERLIVPDAHAVGALCALLQRLVAADGMFDACLPSSVDGVPPRWSTQRGGFLAKAGAGLLRAAESLPIPRSIREAAETTLAAALDACAQNPHDEVHPLLYAYEGALSALPGLRVRSRLRGIATQFDRLWSAAHATGRVPELRSGAAGVRRIDVAAQTVRVAQLLGSALDTPDRWDVTALQRELAAAVHADGAMPFAFDRADTLNTWAAMFTSQALHGLDIVSASGADPLIV